MFDWFSRSKPQQVRNLGGRQQYRSTGGPLRSSSGDSSSGLASGGLSRRHRPDYALLIIALLLSAVGLIVVYAISPGLAATRGVDNNYFVVKQVIAIGLGLAAFTITNFLPLSTLKSLRNVLVGLAALGAVVVALFGEEVNGATRWIQIGGLSFQVAEMIKFAVVVWLAVFLVERMQKGEVHDFKKTFRPLLILLAIIAIVVGKIESDLGSTAVMIAIIGIMAFMAGLPIKRIALIASVVVIGTTILIASTPYRRDRVATFLNPTSDCQSTGYQACQALIAVGSGGMFGLGLGSGVQAYGYLPEAANDSIFAIIAEKFGFIGVSIVIALYLLLFSRFKRIIERTKDPFMRLFTVGVMAWIGVQAMINMGAMIGLLPLKGITLPFISYGGTSILFMMAALGVVFHISRYTSFEPIRNSVSKSKKETSDDNRPLRGRVGRPYYTASSRRT